MQVGDRGHYPISDGQRHPNSSNLHVLSGEGIKDDTRSAPRTTTASPPVVADGFEMMEGPQPYGCLLSQLLPPPC